MISVIIPAYNPCAEATIEGCLDSIICQTYSDLEVIVVDAGSRDQTVSLVQKYALKDKRRYSCLLILGKYKESKITINA